MGYTRRLPAAWLLDAADVTAAAADAVAARTRARPRPSTNDDAPAAVEDPPRRHGRAKPATEAGSMVAEGHPAGTPEAPLTRHGVEGTQPPAARAYRVPAHPWPAGTVVTWPTRNGTQAGVISGANRQRPGTYWVHNLAAPRSPVALPETDLTYRVHVDDLVGLLERL